MREGSSCSLTCAWRKKKNIWTVVWMLDFWSPWKKMLYFSSLKGTVRRATFKVSMGHRRAFWRSNWGWEKQNVCISTWIPEKVQLKLCLQSDRKRTQLCLVYIKKNKSQQRFKCLCLTNVILILFGVIPARRFSINLFRANRSLLTFSALSSNLWIPQIDFDTLCKYGDVPIKSLNL